MSENILQSEKNRIAYEAEMDAKQAAREARNKTVLTAAASAFAAAFVVTIAFSRNRGKNDN